MEHTAELRGIRFACSLQQESSDYYRMLTPTLEALVRVLRIRGQGKGVWQVDGQGL